jgi:hypothetical protein
VVQGQIGGESRPGSLRSLAQSLRGGCKERAPSTMAQAIVESNPRVGCWSHSVSCDLEE